jgi:hypothetical protein
LIDFNSNLNLQNHLAAWHRAIHDVEQKLASLHNVLRFVIWGAGVHTEFLYQTTSLFHGVPNREYVIVDSDPLKEGKTWRGISIHPPTALHDMSWSDKSLIISSYGSQSTIENAALEIGVAPNRIVRLYDQVSAY